MTHKNIKSPCKNQCAVSGTYGFCISCGRKLAEIGKWTGFSDNERAAIMQELPARLARMKANERTAS